MKSIRIAPIVGAGGVEFLIDIVCECGRNGLTNETTGEVSFKHSILAMTEQGMTLRCDCGKRFQIRSSLELIRHPQSHIHVSDL